MPRSAQPAVSRATGGGTPTAQAINAAAIDLFFKHGYEAATLRDVADKVGLKVASLYNYIDSKQELLFGIMYTVMDDLLREVETAVAEQVDPVERLRAAVRSHVVFHASRTKEVFIGNSELRSLNPRNRAQIIRQRDRYEALFRDIVQAGCDAGVFHVDDVDVKVTSFGLLAMCTGPSMWFSPRGRLSVADLSDLYTHLALRLVGVPGAKVSTDGVANGTARRRVRAV
jgi:TetR/AcrR family transcriptional regulator, cholesterol catabolism regulator